LGKKPEFDFGAKWSFAGANEAAEKLSCGNAKLAGAEARAHFAAIAARLKSCPVTKP
jgi:hypothetical protein